MSIYLIIPIVLVVLISFGYAIKKFSMLRETVVSGSGLILYALAALGGYVLQMLPFLFDYAEVKNLAQKAEENIMWSKVECEHLLFTITFAGSFAVFLAGFCFEKFYRDKKLVGWEVATILTFLSIGAGTQGYIVFYNYVIHVQSYNYIDHEPVEVLGGYSRFLGGAAIVALNIIFSMLSVAWPYLFDKFRDRKFDPKVESKPVPVEEEKKDDKPIGAPDTVKTGDYKPEPMNLNVPVLTKPAENFPLPFNLRA